MTALSLINSCAQQLVSRSTSQRRISRTGNQRARFFTAAGSTGESLAALRVAVAWGYLQERDVAAAAELLRRIAGMLWRLTRG
jgi:hypothetical protein